MKRPTLLVIKTYQALYWIKYQVLFSVFGFVSHCKHTPSCSQFALEQIQERGTISGLRRALFRLATCW